ncbi:MAG: VWA domain-containing protein, partial [Bacteroidota bacterium]
VKKARPTSTTAYAPPPPSIPTGRTPAEFGDAPIPASSEAVEFSGDGFDTYRGAKTERKESLSAGTLTAGEIHDFSKWELWNDLSYGDLSTYAEAWDINAEVRYPVQVQTPQGLPVVDAEVVMRDARGGLRWSARTDNTGKAELWRSLFVEEDDKDLTLEVRKGEVISEPVANIKAFPEGLNQIVLDVPCEASTAVDVAFVVDATGSMGDEIEYLKVELADVISGFQESMPELDVNVGSVFYRDHSDAYLTRHIDFQEKLAPVMDFIRRQSAGGGGDNPEAVESALQVAMDSLNWSRDARARLLFLVLDAPPHNTKEIRLQWERLTKQAARKGVRIIPVTGSGIDKSTEYLMRTLALATNGTYTFLTDHSGVGGAHIEPSTDSYEVELLSNLLSRLLYSYTESPDCENWQPDPAWLAQDSTQNPVDSTLIASTDSTVQNVPDPRPKPDLIQITVSPNPTSGPFEVRVSEPVDHLYLTDMNGKILARYDMGKALVKSLDIRHFATGLYLITADPEKRAKGVKLVLQR